jgi:hypothetical protein
MFEYGAIGRYFIKFFYWFGPPLYIIRSLRDRIQQYTFYKRCTLDAHVEGEE